MIPELEWWEVLIRVAVAAGLTGAIGLDRELRDRAAGLRTHMLVGIGAAVFTIVSAYGWSDFQFSTASGVVFDPTRIAAQACRLVAYLEALNRPISRWTDPRSSNWQSISQPPSRLGSLCPRNSSWPPMR